MKKIILLGILFVSSVGFAEESGMSSEYMEKKIHKGDWTIGGSAALNYNSHGGTRLYGNFDGQYFFADRFSAGVFTTLMGGTGYDASGLGVKGTYHFYEGDKTTYFLALGLSHLQSNSEFFSSNSQYATMGSVTLGMNYFLSPHVSFGPRLEYNRVLNENVQSLDLKDFQLNMTLGFTLYF